MNRRPEVRGTPVTRVPPRGFEPLISTLKGWRPRPLDGGGRAAASVAAARSEPLSADHRKDDRAREASRCREAGEPADERVRPRPAVVPAAARPPPRNQAPA